MKKRKIEILVLSIIVLFCIILYAGTHQSTADIKKYGHWDKHDLHGKLYVFPDTLENMNAEKYLYRCTEGLLDSNYQIYLRCICSEEMYNKEVERLKNISTEYKGKKQEIHYDEENFKYPAYVSIYNFDGTYEYALLDEENLTIHYIYLQFINENKVRFDKKLLSKNYSDGDVDNIFDIYAYSVDSIGGWVTDDETDKSIE